MVVVELNGDGIDDLVVATYSDNVIWTFLGDGSLGWDASTSYQSYYTNSLGCLGLGDISGDGEPEVLVGSRDVVSYLERGNVGDDWSHVGLSSLTDLSNANDVCSADLNGDGFGEFVRVGSFGDAGNESLVIADGRDGSLLSVSDIGMDGLSLYGCGAFDFDRDGDADILVVSSQGEIYLIENLLMDGAIGGYDTWVSLYGITGDDALPDADPNQDGYSNFLSYAFGINPLSPFADWGDNLLECSVDSSVGVVDLEFKLPAVSRMDVLYRVMKSPDLDAWEMLVESYDGGRSWTGTGSVMTGEVKGGFIRVNTETTEAPLEQEFFVIEVLGN